MGVALFRRSVQLAVLGVLSVFAGIFLSGCETRIGEAVPNIAPTVEFVNVPPPGTTFSGGAFLYWVGRDPDGQVTQYRLAIVREFDIANFDTTDNIVAPIDSVDVENFIETVLNRNGLTDSVWNYLPVTADDPATSEVVNLYADLDRPVLNRVPQVVFIQAFDEQNVASRIVFRTLRRFDNPPQTDITNFNRLVPPIFINALTPGGLSGIRLSWRGTDPIDFPAEAPPFEFEWKLFGPFTQADSTIIRQSVIKTVFVTNDGQVFIVGESTEDYVICDTIPDGDSLIISCTVIDPDTVTASNPFGTLSVGSYLDLNDPDWKSNDFDERVGDSSFNGLDSWVSGTRDSMFNVFREFPGDSTIERKYILWVRARDDAKVPDLTPAFVMFSVIDAKFERDLGIFSMPKGSSVTNGASSDVQERYWDSTITWYKNNGGYQIEFDTSKDFQVYSTQILGDALLKPLLSCKALILIHDQSMGGAFGDDVVQRQIARAMSAGVSVWYIGRSLGKPPTPAQPPNAGTPVTNPVYSLSVSSSPLGVTGWPGIQDLFGALATQYTGWDWHIRSAPADQRARVESFIGTYTFDQISSPALVVDTFRLERYFNWNSSLPFRRSSDGTMFTGAYPEVNWILRDFRTELIYLYRSNDTLGHPKGPNYFYNAKPVAFRWDRVAWRSAFWGFNPMVMDQSTALPSIRTQINWLLLPSLGGAPRQDLNSLSEEEIRRMMELANPSEPERNQGWDHTN